jgi:hypothetical protein
MTATEASLSKGRPQAAGPGRRALPRTLAWLPTWDLITTKNLEIRKRRGLIITVAVLIVAPAVIIYGVRLLLHAVDPQSYGPAGSPGLLYDMSNLIAELGFIGAVALGAAAGTTDLSDGMFRHLVITGRSRLALYLARIPAGLAIIVPLVALAFSAACLVTSYEGAPAPTTVGMSGLNIPKNLGRAELQAWILRQPPKELANELPIPDLPGGPGAAPAAQVRSAVDKNIATLYRDYLDDEADQSNPGNAEMAEIGLWVELEIGIGFLVGLGLGSLTGQRTTTTIAAIALDLIVTPLMAGKQIPYFIDGQRLIVGVAMDQLSPAALGLNASNAGGGPGGLVMLGGGQAGGLGIPPMPEWAMISVIVGWIVGWSVIGAWRMMTRDA